MIIDGARAADRTSALILRYYAALNRGDIDGMLDCVAEDVVHDINQGARETGKTAYRDYLTRVQRSYREELRDIVVMSIDDGTRAAAEFSVHGVYQATEAGLPPARGQRYTLPGGGFFAIHQGKIARVSHYYNLHERTAQVVRAV
ncbi:MAG: ketosteroid isomerase-related protein [Rudaea sp.]|nr:ketosteroid isomerase-related protein [Rudaea sp.]